MTTSSKLFGCDIDAAIIALGWVGRSDVEGGISEGRGMISSFSLKVGLLGRGCE